MKKFLAALLGSSLVFGLAGCKIEILDGNEDNTEDKDEDVTPNPNPNPDGGGDNGGGDVVAPTFSTLQDALDYLNGDESNFDMKMVMEVSKVEDLTDMDSAILMVSSESNGSIDGNIMFEDSEVTLFDEENPDGVTTRGYTYTVTNDDGTETVYVSTDNENWTIGSASEDGNLEFNPDATFEDLSVEDFDYVQYKGYVSNEELTAELGSELIINIENGNFTVRTSMMMPMPSFELDPETGDIILDENGNPILDGYIVISIAVQMSNFGKVSLTLPTVTE